MRFKAVVGVTICASLGACSSTPEPLSASRSAFNNPYADPVIENGPVGPECQDGVIRDNQCWVDGIGYPLGRGFVRTADGRIIRLDRNQRRWERERAEAVQSRKDALESLKNGTPLPPGSPALPQNQSRPAAPPPPPPPSGDARNLPD